jgi:aminobenzoyl-glutamate transport protein
MTSTADDPRRRKLGSRVLDGVERLGNSLPDPIFLFIILIAILFVVSAIAAAQGLSTVNPVTGETIRAESLFSSENLRQLFVDMPKTLTSFPPLGLVLTVILGPPSPSGQGCSAPPSAAPWSTRPRRS